MCGIAGIMALDGDLVISKDIVSMVASLKHRGPDDEGYLLAEVSTGKTEARGGTNLAGPAGLRCDLVLGHRRLSIIDLSAKGHQPMSSDDGSMWIVHNGEIFNFADIREELKAKGCVFSSATDTEVILKSYQEWGKDCVERFNGQWAFCIYDVKEKSLFCSRDRFGIKPFYYYWDGKTFAFASEIKALLELSFVKDEVNEDRVFRFLASGLLEYDSETQYKDIKELRLGHNLLLGSRTGSLRIQKHYELECNSDFGSYSHKRALGYADDIRALLTGAVKARLIADVPIGTCLSGGIDSSSVVAIINKLLRDGSVDQEQIGEKQKTFTAVYDGEQIDERNYAEEMIRESGAQGHFTGPDAEGLWEDLDNLVCHQDGLFGSTSVYSQWCVMKLASRHVKVVLDGQGSDELFGGYTQHDLSYLKSLIKNFRPFELVCFSANTLRKRWRAGGGRSLGRIFGNHSPHPVISKVMRGRVSAARGSSPQGSTSNLNRRLLEDETRFTLPVLLRYEDRNSSAFSIESRVPFVDHNLVEYVSKIPACYKLHNGWNKWLLRLAMRDMLPERILWRRDKIGFASPEAAWLTAEVPNNRYVEFAREMDIKSNFRGQDFACWRAFLVRNFLEKHAKVA